MKARAGVTLIETMIAGAILVLVLTAAFHGIVTSTRVCHENARLLAAEAYAWETAWIWLNKNWESLDEETKSYTLSDEDCPQIGPAALGEAAVCVVRVTNIQEIDRHGDTIAAKQIDVDVEWGAPGDRRTLNNLASASLPSSGLPISVTKSSINRNP